MHLLIVLAGSGFASEVWILVKTFPHNRWSPMSMNRGKREHDCPWPWEFAWHAKPLKFGTRGPSSRRSRQNTSTFFSRPTLPLTKAKSPPVQFSLYFCNFYISNKSDKFRQNAYNVVIRFAEYVPSFSLMSNPIRNSHLLYFVEEKSGFAPWEKTTLEQMLMDMYRL